VDDIDEDEEEDFQVVDHDTLEVEEVMLEEAHVDDLDEDLDTQVEVLEEKAGKDNLDFSQKITILQD